MSPTPYRKGCLERSRTHSLLGELLRTLVARCTDQFDDSALWMGLSALKSTVENGSSIHTIWGKTYLPEKFWLMDVPEIQLHQAQVKLTGNFANDICVLLVIRSFRQILSTRSKHTTNELGALADATLGLLGH
jgi:hypothetical protein